MEKYQIPGIYGIDTRKLVRSIRDLGSRKVLITLHFSISSIEVFQGNTVTLQPHLFKLLTESLANTRLKITHLNLLDQTVEGVACEEDRVFRLPHTLLLSVQDMPAYLHSQILPPDQSQSDRNQ